MLSLSNVSVEMAASYFEEDDYYKDKDEKLKPEFYGRGLERLGVHKTFDKEIFNELLHGYSPDGKDRVIAYKNHPLSVNELTKVLTRFDKKSSSISITEHHSAYVKNCVLEKMESKNEHLSRETANSVRADINLFIKNMNLDSETKKLFKIESMKLLKSLSKSGHRAAIDCTFSAPKSVSLASLVGGKKDLIQAHKEAVDYALSQLEKDFIGTRIGPPSNRQFITTGNLVCAKFLHRTSRESDPQVHTHCVIFNMTQRQDGKWRSTHNDEIFKNSKLLGAIYQNKLAEKVQKLGYEIDVNSNGTFELRGYSREQINVFSKRRKQVVENTARMLYSNQVKEFLTEKGIKFTENSSHKGPHFALDTSKQNAIELGLAILPNSPKVITEGFVGSASYEAQKMTLSKLANQKLNRESVKKDRKVKSDIQASELETKWVKEAQSHDIQHPEPKKTEKLFGKKLDNQFAIQHLSERKAVFKDNEILLQSLIRNLGRSTYDSIKESIQKNPNIAALKRSDRGHAIVKQMADEAYILLTAHQTKNTFKAIENVKEAQSIAEKRGYTEGQFQALKQALTSTDKVILWNGVAGSGKTFALADLKEIAEQKRYKVLSLAPDASTAKALGNSVGSSASTIHSFVAKPFTEKGNTLLIVDEAGRISTRLMRELLTKIEGTKTRVLFTGDVRQLGSVEAGNPFGALIKNGVSTVNLNEHQRQKTVPLREAVEHISKRSAEEIKAGLERISEHIFERKGSEARMNLVMKKYRELSHEQQEKTLLLADTNKEREQLTHKIRNHLKESGLLGKEEVALTVLIPKDMTEAQKNLASFYEKNQIVHIRNRNEFCVVKGQKGLNLILESQNGSLKINPSKVPISVFETKSIPISNGDKLEWRMNTEDHTNREDLRVIQLEKGFAMLQNPSGRTYKISTNEPQFLDYSHVKTTYSSQGMTCDRVIALTHSNLSKESLYVLTSRAREQVEIITDSRERLMSNAQRSSEKENTLPPNFEKQNVKNVPDFTNIEPIYFT